MAQLACRKGAPLRSDSALQLIFRRMVAAHTHHARVCMVSSTQKFGHPGTALQCFPDLQHSIGSTLDIRGGLFSNFER
jgi:hypothetical protein